MLSLADDPHKPLQRVGALAGLLELLPVKFEADRELDEVSVPGVLHSAIFAEELLFPRPGDVGSWEERDWKSSPELLLAVVKSFDLLRLLCN